MVVKLSEYQIQNQIMSWLKMNGVFSFIVKSNGTFDPLTKRFRKPGAWYKRGCPDILCIRSGQFIGLEVKTPKGSLSMHQKMFHQEIRNAGGQVFVVRDVKDLVGIFK